MSNIEKIKAEIERLKNENAEWRERINSEDGYSYESDVCCGYDEAIEDFETFIDSLPEEKPSEDLAEAAENIYKTPFGTRAEDFIAGAEWQAEKCDEETSKLLYAERQTAYINGWDDHKEQMLKDAVEGEVIYDLGGFFRIKSEAIDGAKYKVGSWVKLIIVKED